jgi:hypothetical protein
LPVRRKEIRNVVKDIKAHNPNAVYTIEDVRAVSSGDVPMRGYQTASGRKPLQRIFFYRRKSK